MTRLKSLQNPRQRGSTLIVVVIFLALLTILVLGFLARSLLDLQISESSSDSAKADYFARGTVDCLVGDLKQEIVDGSTITNALYLPKARGNMVSAYSGINPVISGGLETDGMNNVLKVSVGGSPFYLGGISRASNIFTTAASLNNKSVSRADWNEPLLMPVTSASDPTPNTLNFPTPNWIYVARDGSNPGGASSPATFGSTGLTVNNSNSANSSYVVGRFAYVIYNEGGLLDANVAGSPQLGSLTPAQIAVWSRKGPAAFADLTQSQIGLTQSQVDTLVGWRNQASAQVPGSSLNYFFSSGSTTNYFNSLLGLNTGFMSVGNSTLYNGNITDRAFNSRQQLITFIKGIPGLSLSSAETALQYLGTFSRSLNQPSYSPPASRPHVTGGPALLASGTGYTGGNSAYPFDDIYNPTFRSARVTTGGWSRNDGSIAAAGEPLVKNRFALSRVCWITYKGPIANLYINNPADPAIQQLLQDGVPLSLIQEGTATNIMNYFGLTWNAGPGTGGLGGYWVYYHGLSSGGQTVIGSLNDPSGPSVSATNPLREADFFELLKAAVDCGAIGKTLSFSQGTNFTAITESSITIQILQIGANIIDQANPTQFPTHIEYNWGDGGNFLRSIYGSMDLPYFYSDHEIAYISDQSKVNIPSVSWPTPNLLSGTPALPPLGPTTAGTLSDAGTVEGMMVPSIWNAYDTLSSSGANYPSSSNNLAPMNLRITVVPAALTDPTNIAGSGNTPGTNSYTVWRGDCRDPVPYGTGTPNLASQNNLTTKWPTEDSTALTFTNVTSLYREPTILIQPQIPAGSNLSIGPNNIIKSSLKYDSIGGGIPEVDSNNNKIDELLGFSLGEYPQTFAVSSIADSANGTTYTAPGGQTYYCTVDSLTVLNRPGGTSGSTIRMEYQVPGGSQWIPYEEIYFNFVNTNIPTPYYEGTTATHPSVLFPLGGGSYWSGSFSGGNYTGTYSAPFAWIGPSGANGTTFVPGYFEGWFGDIMWDPRTTRFGENNERPCLPLISSSVTTDSTVYSHRPTTANDLFSPGAIGGLNETSEGWFTISSHTFVGGISQNLNVPTTGLTATYYSDPDGIVRRAMGGHAAANPSSPTGLPMANPSANSSRPIFLHRPYRSVAELGYVFSDTSWRNLDFSTSESGYNALLDVFCINEEIRSDALVAGRVDLNTRQAPVLQALISGAYRDEIPLATSIGSDIPLTGATASSEAGTLATLLIQRTTSSGKGPLENIADLVGSYVPGVTNPNQEPYDGFSDDLNYSAGPSPGNNIVSRFRESAFRALSDAGQAGTWNLLIDVVAQTGRCSTSAQTLDQFLVQGERHFWVHVAIDRQTGQVIDENIERVSQ